MTHTAVLITDMAILVGIFLMGFLAKLFPRSGGNAGEKQGAGFRDQGSGHSR